MNEAPKVFIRDEAYAWIPGSIVAIKDGKAVVRIELPKDWHSNTILCEGSGLEEVEDALAAASNAGDTGSDQPNQVRPPSLFRSVVLATYPSSQLPLQNKCGHKSDMALLPHLHEAAMLYNLKERNRLRIPYTRVRDVIVAMNPFERIEELYSLQMQQSYAKQLVWQQAFLGEDEKKDDASNPIDGLFPTREGIEPHIYEVSCLAYRGIAVDHQDQTILVTGESGSGKTETVKILLEHLATLEFLCPEKQMEVPGTNLDVVNKVMESSEILEAFGNAQTRRNDNSSRFGKLVQLHFTTNVGLDDPGAVQLCSLIGSHCTTYLLEKTRVVSHGVGERSFHIFYQLLAAPMEFKRDLWPFFASLKPTEFAYLAQFGECDLEREDDASQWTVTANALRTFDLQGEQLCMLMRTLAIVLQLGNLKFGDAHTSDGERLTIVTTTSELSRLSEMMGIDEQDLEKSLTSRGIKTNFDELRVPLQPSVAKESTDALAKEIYSRTFAYIVRHLNDQMRSKNEDDVCGSIALVDIYGFERLAVNRFEQLCINYANEQLQQKYVADNFRVLKQEYDQEGIDIFDFSLVDNSDVLDLLDGRSGVFVALQEECVRPMANDETFVEKVKKANGTHARLVTETIHGKTEFGIRHFAGPVIYDATKFVDRNMDRVSEDLLHCASKSVNSIISNELQRALEKRSVKSISGESTSDRRISGMTLIEKFSTELRDLLVAMDGTKTRYIRCIIPNEFRSPGVTNHLMTLRQLEYAGLMTSVALTRESLPDSLSYKTLLRRFGCLLKHSDRLKMQEMELADQIVYLLTNLFVPTLQRQDRGPPPLPFACGKTKAYLRAGALDHLEVLRYRFFSMSAMRIQSSYRRWQDQKMYLTLRSRVIALQAASRKFLIRKTCWQRAAAARLLVRWFRVRMIERAHVQLSSQVIAAKKIQANWRAMRVASSYKNLIRSVVFIQRSHRCRLRFRKQLESLPIPIGDADNSSNDVGALAEARKLVALRKAAIPRFRRADHSFLAEIDALLGNVSCEFEALRFRVDATPELSTTKDPLDREIHSPGNAVAGRGIMEKVSQEFTMLHEQILLDDETQKRELERLGKLLSEQEAQHREDTELWMTRHRAEIAIIRDANRDEIAQIRGAHLKEIQQLKGQLSLMQREKLAALAAANKAKEARAADMERMQSDRTKYSTENATLKEKLARYEDNSRAEKEELCKMIQEVEESHKEECRNLRAEIVRGEQMQQKLRTEIDLFRAQYEKDIEAAAATFASNLSELEAKKAELENELKQKETQSKDECDQLRRIHEDLEKMQENHAREKGKLHDELNLAQQVQSALRAEMSKLQVEHASKQEKLMAEIQDLKKSLEQRDIKAESEDDRAKETEEAAESKYREEIRQLREELFWTQEAQRQLKSEISEMEASHAEELEKTKIDALDDFHETNETITVLQEKLQMQEQASRDEKEELCNMLKASEESHKEEVRKLSEEIRNAQDAYRQVKIELNKQQAAHAEEIEKLMTKTLDYCNMDAEIGSWKEKALAQETMFREEKERLRSWLKDHLENVRKLKAEFEQSQESHILHLLHVVAQLEQLQSQRNNDVEGIMEEIEVLCKQKDDVILALRAELLELQTSCSDGSLMLKAKQPDSSSRLPTILEGVEISKEELVDLQARLDQVSSVRSAHCREFQLMLQELQKTIKPENLKYILRKIRKNHDASLEAKVFAEIHRMSVALGDLYDDEISAQDDVQRDLSAFFDRLVTALDPTQENKISATIQAEKAEPSNQVLHDLQQRVEAIEKHNFELRARLKAKSVLMLDPMTSGSSSPIALRKPPPSRTSSHPARRKVKPPASRTAPNSPLASAKSLQPPASPQRSSSLPPRRKKLQP